MRRPAHAPSSSPAVVEQRSNDGSTGLTSLAGEVVLRLLEQVHTSTASLLTSTLRESASILDADESFTLSCTISPDGTGSLTSQHRLQTIHSTFKRPTGEQSQENAER